MFESIFTAATDGSIDVSMAIISFGVALAIGLVIGIAYMYANKKSGYNKDFIVGLVLLPAIVSVVILLVGSNVARAFSMAGAFALVRFRSAPGSAKDISVVFFSMAAGLACGLGYVSFAVIFAIVMLLVFVALSVSGFADRAAGKRQLKITIPENLNYTEVFDDIFDKFTTDAQLARVKTTNMGTMFELTYIIQMLADVSEKAFLDAIRMKNGNLNITLGMVENNSSQLN